MISTNIWRKFIELTLNMFFFFFRCSAWWSLHDLPVRQPPGRFVPNQVLNRFGPHICNTMGQSLHLANTITQQPPDRFIRQDFFYFVRLQILNVIVSYPSGSEMARAQQIAPATRPLHTKISLLGFAWPANVQQHLPIGPSAAHEPNKGVPAPCG